MQDTLCDIPYLFAFYEDLTLTEPFVQPPEEVLRRMDQLEKQNATILKTLKRIEAAIKESSRAAFATTHMHYKVKSTACTDMFFLVQNSQDSLKRKIARAYYQSLSRQIEDKTMQVSGIMCTT